MYVFLCKKMSFDDNLKVARKEADDTRILLRVARRKLFTPSDLRAADSFLEESQQAVVKIMQRMENMNRHYKAKEQQVACLTPKVGNFASWPLDECI